MNKPARGTCRPRRVRRLTLLLSTLAMLSVSACGGWSGQGGEAPRSLSSANAADTAMVANLLAYPEHLARMTSAELSRERNALSAQMPTPVVKTRLALLFMQQHDLLRAQSTLDSMLKSADTLPGALLPFVRLIHQQVGERVRLEQLVQRQASQNEQQAQQLRESQRRVAELQEKIEALADIERSLKARPGGIEQRGVPSP